MIANKSNKAIVLIATIATLAVISVILMFFAQSSIFERQLTSNNNLERQAKLVATASIEWAASYIPKLAMGVDDGDSSVSNKAYSSVADFYQFKVINNNESGKYDPHCPVEEHYSANGKGGYTGKPSFYYENKKETGLPYEYSYRQDFDINMVSLPTVHNTNPKVRNDASETEEIEKKRRWTVHSTLKCVDANAFWNINSPINTKENYKNMVSTLVSVVLGKNESIIDKWVEERKKGEFADLGDFRERMSSVKGMEQKDLDRLCRYITVDSWGNEKSFKYGADYTNYDQELSAIFEKRYPININVASWEILTVVFANINANHNHTKASSNITKNEAQKLAKKIVEDRTSHKNGTPFKTWNDVEDYLYKYFDKDKDKAETLFAVIYPGMLPHKKSPNKAQYRKFDKSDIKVGTTECCLFSPGVFYCEAIGRVVEYNREPYTVLADSKVSVNMKLWEPYIVNSQSDFEWQRHKDQQKLATWSGLEGGYYPEEYPAQKDEKKKEVSAGFLQERGYWTSKDSKDKTYPDACRFWSWAKDNPDAFEKRVDGVYMKSPKNDHIVPGILEEAYDIKNGNKENPWNDSEWKANKWQDDGFDLWIKPSYDDGDKADASLDDPEEKPLLIAVKKEKAETVGTKCYILTRCAYDFDSTKESPYLTISRTLVTDEKSGGIRETKDPRGFRIFYNSTILPKVKHNTEDKLYDAGEKVFTYFITHVAADAKKFFFEDRERMDYDSSFEHESKFATDFANNVYRAIMEETEYVDIHYKIWSSKRGNSRYRQYEGEIRIFLPVNFNPNESDPEKEKFNWHHARIMNGLNSEGEFKLTGEEGSLFYLHRVFDKKPCITKIEEIEEGKIKFGKLENDPKFYYGYVNRNSRQKEATELAWFPGKDDLDPNVPMQTKYKYSRTESRIPNIKLHKGCWYHIHARWEADKILLTDFKVHYKDGDKIKEDQGKLYKNLFGSPGRVWTTSDDYNKEERMLYPPNPHKEGNKTYFYCNNCVISFSHYRSIEKQNKKGKAWRYWSNESTSTIPSSVYTGNFNEGNIITGDPKKDNKFNLPKMYKSQKHPQDFYYGTVAWTHFYPKDKNSKPIENKKTIFTINNHEFSSWGEESKPQKKPNSIFMKQYSNKDDSPDASFRFELHDEGGDASASHLETTIVDRVVLYMIVQPQPIHWSYNTYKDKNLYQKQ